MNDHVCVRCDYQGAYAAVCPSCNASHTMRAWQAGLFAPALATPANDSRGSNGMGGSGARVAGIQFRSSELPRVKTGLPTLDLALGGGFVMGASTLLAGDAGTGKSTLALRLAEAIPGSCYVASEEGRAQVEDRAARTQCALACPLITADNDGPLQDVDLLMRALSGIATRKKGLEGVRLVIVDSLQGFGRGAKRNIENASALEKLAHALGVALLVTGQVVKDGSVAGPNELRHLFDTVILLEKTETFARVLFVDKSRFAPSPASHLLLLSAKGWEEVPREGTGAEGTPSTLGGNAHFG